MAQFKKDLTVLIGRFSPFHDGHVFLLENAFKTSKHVLVLIGSAGQARTTKNPFTFDERAKMITNWAHTTFINMDRLFISPLKDHPYNDAAWIREVQDLVDATKTKIGLKPNSKVHLTGANRDSSTWYLNAFGDTFVDDTVALADHGGFTLSATQVRDILFTATDMGCALKMISGIAPKTTLSFLRDFADTETYADLKREYEFIAKYKKAWANAPYEPSFITVDACVIQSGHVLVNVRDNFPGKGLWALPGGFLEPTERAQDGAVRELIEETSIELSRAQLYGSIKSREIFDHPERSLRGRTLTICYLFKLDDTKPLPKVKPQRGEVKKVMWLPIAEALRHTDKWFEDHHSLLSTMVARIGTIA